MKKSLINDYLKNLSILLNDKRINFAITANYADKCNIAIYFESQVLTSITIFNDSSVINLDNLINDYKAIMSKHPMRNKNLFSLRYDYKSNSTLAITDKWNLELYGVKHKRISKALADYLYSLLANGIVKIDNQYTNSYMATYDFNITYMFTI